MRYWMIALAAMLLFACSARGPVNDAAPSASAAGPNVRIGLAPKDLPAPPILPAFQAQKPEMLRLSNGMRVLLAASEELPLARGLILFPGGSSYEPAGQEGLASMAMEVWREGGTQRRSADQISAWLEDHASSIEAGSGGERAQISFDTLSENLLPTLDLLAELMREPAYDPNYLEVSRQGMLRGIASQNDSAGEIMNRELGRLLEGRDSIHQRMPSFASVRAVQIEDVRRFQSGVMRPERMVMAISGVFDREQLLATLERMFADWPAATAIEQQPDPGTPAPPGLYFASKDDTAQSVIGLGHQGIRRDDPDFAAVEVFNEVLAGGFSSRLLTRLRTDLGLTYGVGGGIRAGWRRPGNFVLSFSTKVESTVAGIEALLGELQRLEHEPPTQAEIELAKTSILNSYIFRMDTAEKLLDQQVLAAFHDYPDSLLEDYREQVLAVTVADVKRASERVQREQLRILVVGPGAGQDRPLETLGPVTPIDVRIVPDAPAKPTPGA